MAKRRRNNRSAKDKCSCKSCHCHARNCGSAIYGLGFIGAAVYYVSTATSFWMGVLGILKAIVWPAFLVYQFLQVLGI
jgi:hypothetical protein